MLVSSVLVPLAGTALADVQILGSDTLGDGDELGDAINGGGTASDLVALDLNTSASGTELIYNITTAGTDNPKLIHYRVNFTVPNATGVVKDYSVFTSLQTDDTFISSLVCELDANRDCIPENTTEIQVKQDGTLVSLIVDRTAVGNPAAGVLMTDITARTSQGESGPFFDLMDAGPEETDEHPWSTDDQAYRIENREAPRLAAADEVYFINECTQVSIPLNPTDDDDPDPFLTAKSPHWVTTSPFEDPNTATVENDFVEINTTNPFDVWLNQTSDTFEWRPSGTDNGTYWVNFTAWDGDVFGDRVELRFDVFHAQCAPSFDAPSEVIVPENESVSVPVTAEDPQGDPISIDVLETRVLSGFGKVNQTTNLPENMTADVTTGIDDSIKTLELNWTPSFTQAGVYEIDVISTDFIEHHGNLIEGSSSVWTLVVNVTNNQTAPFFTTIYGNQTVTEGDQIQLPIVASDVQGDRVNLTGDLTDLPRVGPATPPATSNNASLESGTFDVWESSTGVFEVNGSVDEDTTAAFNWTPSFRANGTYTVNITALDGPIERTLGPAADWLEFNITVEEFAGPELIPNSTVLMVSEGETLTLDLDAEDPDNDTLAFGSPNAPEGVDIVPVDHNSSQLVWTPTFDQAGTYEIDVNVTDGAITDTKTITIYVLEDNAGLSLAPESDVTAFERQTVVIDLEVDDPDAEATFSVVNAPAKSTFDTGTGEFIWTPTFDDEGTYTVGFEATDGANTASLSVTIDVLDDEPVLTSRVINDPVGLQEDAFILTQVKTANGGVGIAGADVTVDVEAQPAGPGTEMQQRSANGETNEFGTHLFEFSPDVEGEFNLPGNHPYEATATYTEPGTGLSFALGPSTGSYQVVI